MGLQLGTCLGTLKDGDYWQLPFGKLIVHGNELHVLTENADPAAFSLLGFTEGKWSWKDEAGLEKCCLGMRVNAKGDGEWYFGAFSTARFAEAMAKGTAAWVAKANDYAMEEVATLSPDGFEVRVALKASAGIVGSSSGGELHRFYSDDGFYCFNVQGPGSGQPDGKIIQYRIVDDAGHRLADESQWVPVAEWAGTPYPTAGV